MKSAPHRRDANGNVVEIFETQKICFDYISNDNIIEDDQAIF